jgi:ATP-dependent DNA helicase RecG
MEALELIEIIKRGEDSHHQFKENITNAESLAGEMVAFSNSDGGMLIIGVDKNGSIVGIPNEQIERISQLISNTASNNVRNPINLFTENVMVDEKLLTIINVPLGIDKPYMDKNGAVWVKNGSDKRRVTSKEELRRLFQSSDIIHSDEIPIHNSTINDLDIEYFKLFYHDVYNSNLEEIDISIDKLMNNLNLAVGTNLNYAGLLIFGKNPQRLKPQFIIKAVNFIGVDAAGSEFRDKEDIDGKIQEQYIRAIAFINRNLRKIQTSDSFNISGQLEIPNIVFEELVANAIMHRNYFIDSPIRIFMLDNRIEIISPGVLPNNLTVENIKNGVSVIRNPIIASFVTKNNLIKYSGFGTGVIRTLKNYKNIEFYNEEQLNQFKVVIQRPS